MNNIENINNINIINNNINIINNNIIINNNNIINNNIINDTDTMAVDAEQIENLHSPSSAVTIPPLVDDENVRLFIRNLRRERAIEERRYH